MGKLFTDLDLIGGAGHVQRLLVGIHRHKLHALGPRANHAVDDVVAAAAHADDFNIDNGIGTGLQSKCHSGASYYHLCKGAPSPLKFRKMLWLRI